MFAVRFDGGGYEVHDHLGVHDKNEPLLIPTGHKSRCLVNSLIGTSRQAVQLSFIRLFLQVVVPLIVFSSTLFLSILAALPAHAACSADWRSPQTVWLNEYYFGTGGGPPNFLELYSTSPVFSTQWQGAYVDVFYKQGNNIEKNSYVFGDTTATSCTISNKNWITYNVSGGLVSGAALVILRDSNGDSIDALVFDNNTSPAPWVSETDNWAPGKTTGCDALDTALTGQATAAQGGTRTQANMLVVDNNATKGFARFPDGDIWDLTENTGAGTTYSQCTNNNANFTKEVDNTAPSPGSTVTFTLSIVNTGNGDLTGISLDDYLPDYTYTDSVAPTFISAIPVNPDDSVTTTSDPDVNDPNTSTTSTRTKVTWAPAAIAEGTTALLYIKMQVPSNAEPGYVYNNVAQTTAGLDPNQTDFADFTIGSSTVGSFVISVNPATAGACTTDPWLGPKVTITAMTLPNGTGVVDTAYTGESPSGTSVFYLSATSANPDWYASSGNPITVSPVPADSFTNGVATFYLLDHTGETIQVSALDVVTDSPGYMQGASGDITFTADDNAIVLTDGDSLTPLYGAVSGRPHHIRATISECGVTATDRTGTYNGNIGYTAGLNHPVGATAPTISTTAACPGAIGPLSTGTDTAISLAFTSGITDFYLCTSDVGQFALNIELNLPNPNGGLVPGSSGNFTVRPFVITATGFTGGTETPSNPKGSLPTDVAFTKAGHDFSGTFAAWNWRSNEDSDNDGIPDATAGAADFSSTTHSRPARFSGTTDNAGGITFAAQLNTPAGGVSSDFVPSPSPATATGGAVTISTFNYPEVGSITIGGVSGVEAYGSINYLGLAGLHVPILSDVIGRFIPDHFTITMGAVVEGCPAGNFTYFDQSSLVTNFTLTAQNQTGTTTRNYTDTFARLDPGAYANLGFTAPALPTGTTLTGSASGTWNNGTTTSLTASHQANRRLASPVTPTPVGPAIITIMAQPVDPDGVTITAATAVGTTELRYGRILLGNVYGPETEALAMPLLILYYDGAAFIANSADTCSVFDQDDLTCAPLSGSIACGDVSAGGVNIGNGQDFTITPNPLNTNTGTLEYTLTAPSWLQYEWEDADNNYLDNPTGQVSFGLYRGNDRIINWREIVR